VRLRSSSKYRAARRPAHRLKDGPWVVGGQDDDLGRVNQRDLR
jgi:hypothetical protein